MSIISELIAILGADNINTIVALILTGLTGKTSWDFYKSKEVVKQHEMKLQYDSFKKSIEDMKSSIDDVKLSLIESKENIVASNEKLQKAEDKISNRVKILEEKMKVADERLTALLDGVVISPKISRAEARRLKEGKSS